MGNKFSKTFGGCLPLCKKKGNGAETIEYLDLMFFAVPEDDTDSFEKELPAQRSLNVQQYQSLNKYISDSKPVQPAPGYEYRSLYYLDNGRMVVLEGWVPIKDNSAKQDVLVVEEIGDVDIEDGEHGDINEVPKGKASKYVYHKDDAVKSKDAADTTELDTNEATANITLVLSNENIIKNELSTNNTFPQQETYAIALRNATANALRNASMGYNRSEDNCRTKSRHGNLGMVRSTLDAHDKTTRFSVQKYLSTRSQELPLTRNTNSVTEQGHIADGVRDT